MNALVDFADALTALKALRLDGGTLEAARMRVFDNLGAVAVGLYTPEGRGLRRVSEGEGIDETVRLLVGSARSTEIDDINIASCTTVGSVVVPVAAACAGAWGSDDLGLLAAVVAGYEAMVRLGTAIDGANILYRGVWPTYVTAPFAAAAAAASLLDLNAAQTAAALSLALVRSPRLQVRAAEGLSPRSYLLGCAATDGLAAARAAGAGFGGGPGALQEFAEYNGLDVNEKSLLDNIGERPRIFEIDSKTFPTSRQAMASVQAFLEQTPLLRPAAEIERIEVAVPGQYRNMIGRIGLPRDRLESITGVAYQLALAALRPEALADDLRVEMHHDDATLELVAKVEVVEDPEMSAQFPGCWPGRVRTSWRDGVEQVTEVREPEGSAARPLGWGALDRKLATILGASGIVSKATTASLLDSCRALGANEAGSGAVGLLELTLAPAGTGAESGMAAAGSGR